MSTITNVTTAPITHNFFLTLLTAQTLSVIVVTLVGNLLLIAILGVRTGKSLNGLHILLIHNCVGDILFAVLTLAPQTAEFNGRSMDDVADWICPMRKYVGVLPLFASPFLLVAISLNRYQAICNPLSNMNAGRARWSLNAPIIAWTLAAFASIPTGLNFHMQSYNHPVTGAYITEYCTAALQPYSVANKINVLYFNVTAWLIPCVTSGVCYYLVCRAVYNSLSHTQHMLVRPLGKMAVSTAVSLDASSEACNAYLKRLREQSETYRKRDEDSNRQKRRTVKLTLAMVVCNFVLWTPFCVANVVQAIDASLIGMKGLTYITMFGNLNSCVNPWIYMIMHWGQVREWFRKAAGRSTSNYNHSLASNMASGYNNNSEDRRHRAAIEAQRVSVATNDSACVRQQLIAVGAMTPNVRTKTSCPSDFARHVNGGPITGPYRTISENGTPRPLTNDLSMTKLRADDV